MGSRSVQRSETTRPLVVCEARAFSSHRMQACHRLVRPLTADRSLPALPTLTCRPNATSTSLFASPSFFRPRALAMFIILGDTHFNLGPKHLVIIGSFFWRTVIHRNLERKNLRCVCLLPALLRTTARPLMACCGLREDGGLLRSTHFFSFGHT